MGLFVDIAAFAFPSVGALGSGLGNTLIGAAGGAGFGAATGSVVGLMVAPSAADRPSGGQADLAIQVSVAVPDEEYETAQRILLAHKH